MKTISARCTDLQKIVNRAIEAKGSDDVSQASQELSVWVRLLTWFKLYDLTALLHQHIVQSLRKDGKFIEIRTIQVFRSSEPSQRRHCTVFRATRLPNREILGRLMLVLKSDGIHTFTFLACVQRRHEYKR